MTESRLTGSDKRALLLWIIFGIIGLWFAQRHFFQAFPEASVDFKVSRNDAQARARQFVQGMGENLDGYQSTITFRVDDNAKTYLERELGLQQANQLMSSQLNIWFWDVRFFKSQQEEEFQVRISPAGQIVGFSHRIEEARGAKSLNREEALTSAQQFLTGKLSTDLNAWNFLPEEANSQTRPNRLDWSFTWERKDFKAKDAPYRLEVGLQGDRISATQEFLQVPEAWTRSYQKLRSSNILYNQVAIIPYGFLMGAALWLAISLTREGKTSWKSAVKVGVIVAILFFLMQANDWNSVRAGYDTRDAYSSFMTETIAKLLLAAIATGLMVTLVLPGGEPLYRASQPNRLRLNQAFSWRGIKSKEFFLSSVVGISMAAAHMGFIVAFYLIGSRFGVWAPQDLNYSDVVNTSFPWIAGVAIGVMAATSEEFLFRLFAIPFLHKMTGSRILAVTLPAFFWSFLHSAYPQEPGYIRGIEVGLIGIVAGLVMLRWGIVTTLIWHYTVDASLVGMLLIRSDNLYFKISGAVVGLAAVAPLALSGLSYLLQGSFEPVDDLLNSAQPIGEIRLETRPIPEQVVSRRRYDSLSPSTIGFLVICLAFGAFCTWKLKHEAIGDYLKLSITNRDAVRKSDEIIREHGLDPATFRRAAEFRNNTDPVTNEFLRRRMSVNQINQIYQDRVPGALWRVRYFRDLQPEEFAVTLKPDGSLQAFRHTPAEEAKGASLSKEDALALAETFLRTDKKIDLSQWKLVEPKSDKLPHRTDHSFTWQQISPLDPESSAAKNSADHAYARMDLQIIGDEPANFRTYIKIPEDFARQQEEQSLPRALLMVGKVVLILGLAVSVLIFYFKNMRSQPPGTVPWRKLTLWSFCGFAAFVASFLLGKGIPSLLVQYHTDWPLQTFYIAAAIGVFILATLLFGLLLLLFGLGWSYGVRAFGAECIPTWFGMPGDYYRDAFCIALGGTAALIALKRILGLLDVWWPTLHRGLPAGFGESYDAIYPAMWILGWAILRGLIAVGILGLGGSFLGAELRVRWLRLGLFLALAASFVSNWGSLADFVKQFLTAILLLGFAIFGIRFVARFNILGCFLVASCGGMLGGAVELLSQPNSFYRMQGYAVVTALLILLTWPLVAWRTAAGKTFAT